MTSTLTGKTAIIAEHPPVSAKLRPAFWQKGDATSSWPPGEDRLESLVSELGDEQTLAIPTDVTDPSACATLVDRTLDHFCSLEVLVNNAGLGLYAPITEADPEDWRTMRASICWAREKPLLACSSVDTRAYSNAVFEPWPLVLDMVTLLRVRWGLYRVPSPACESS